MNSRLLIRCGIGMQQAACSSKTILTPQPKSLIKPKSSVKSTKEGRPGSVASFLRSRIRSTGPVTVAEYMRLCLTAPSGYYASRKAQRVLGERGDFITSPELGQIFGEMVGIWVTNEVYNMGLGPRAPWSLVELGPGSGLLMADVLRVLRQFSYTAALSVHLVEVSDSMTAAQLASLCDPDAKVERADGADGWTQRAVSKFGVPVTWHRRLADVPRRFSVTLAQEFFDALPVHYFQRQADGPKWAEVVVDFDDTQPDKFHFALSARETIALRNFLPPEVRADPAKEHWETSPDSLVILGELQDRIAERGGAALIVDYGHCGEKAECTLRGFRRHEVVSPLDTPGEIDLTADVNFAAFKSCLDPARIMTFGALAQGDFLRNLGVQKRQEMLLSKAKTDKERASLAQCFDVVTSAAQMGERFKVLGLFPATMSNLFAQRKPPCPSGFAPMQ